MQTKKIENAARKMAEQAKPGIVKIDDKIYTFVFNQNEWVYNVFEDGFQFVNFNTKSINKAKQMLKEYLKN